MAFKQGGLVLQHGALLLAAFLLVATVGLVMATHTPAKIAAADSPSNVPTKPQRSVRTPAAV